MRQQLGSGDDGGSICFLFEVRGGQFVKALSVAEVLLDQRRQISQEIIGQNHVPIPSIFSLSTPRGKGRGEGSVVPLLNSRFRIAARHGRPASEAKTMSARPA